MSEQKHSNIESLERLRRRLRNCTTIEELLAVRSTAIGQLAAMHAAREPIARQNAAAEIKLVAERELGSLLRDMNLRGGDRRKKRTCLSDYAISRRESWLWQKLAKIPSHEVRAYFRQCSRWRRCATQGGLLDHKNL